MSTSTKKGRKVKNVNINQKKKHTSVISCIPEQYILQLPITLDKIQSISQNEFNTINNILMSLPNNILPYNSNFNKINLNYINKTQNSCNTQIHSYNQDNCNIVVYNDHISGLETQDNFNSENCSGFREPKKIIANKNYNVACWWCCHIFD